MNLIDDEYLMTLALEEANRAYTSDEVPIGSIITDSSGKILAKAHNQKEHHANPCGHAEILAITAAAKQLDNWRLSDCTLFVTLEPCPMCLAACVQARLKRVVFGAYDSKGGALSLAYNLHNDPRLNHKFNIVGGIKHYECSGLISQFFREKRKGYRANK